MVFSNVGVNYLAILVSTIAAFFIGFMWYGPLFGKRWAKEMGIKMDKNNKEGLGKLMVMNFIGTLLMVYVLAHFVGALSLTTVAGAAQLGFWIWLGFFAAGTLLGGVLWEGKSWTLFTINAAYWLVNLVVIASILAVWS